MDKQFLLSTIDKYHLNGLVEKVKWETKENVLHVKFISINKDMTGYLRTENFELADEEVAIFNTSQLYKLIGITGQFITLSLYKQHKITTKLLIADNVFDLQYALSDTMLIPKTPSIEEPEYETSFLISKELIETFIKAKKAISESDTVTVEAETGLNEPNKVNFMIGEVSDHTNKVSFSTPVIKMADFPGAPLTFNAIYIKEIFDNNRDVEQGIGFISDQGLMKIVMKTEKTEVVYFLTAKE